MDRYVGPPGSEAGVTNSVCLGFKRVVRLCGTAVACAPLKKISEVNTEAVPV